MRVILTFTKQLIYKYEVVSYGQFRYRILVKYHNNLIKFDKSLYGIKSGSFL